MPKKKKIESSCKDCKYLSTDAESMYYCEVFHGMLDSAVLGCCFFEAKEKGENNAEGNN